MAKVGQVWARKVPVRWAHDFIRITKVSPSGKTLYAIGCNAAGARVSMFNATELRAWRLARDYTLHSEERS